MYTRFSHANCKKKYSFASSTKQIDQFFKYSVHKRMQSIWHFLFSSNSQRGVTCAVLSDIIYTHREFVTLVKYYQAAQSNFKLCFVMQYSNDNVALSVDVYGDKCKSVAI